MKPVGTPVPACQKWIVIADMRGTCGVSADAPPARAEGAKLAFALGAVGAKTSECRRFEIATTPL